ncbi:lipopolysaccharide biosynthesis protein [Vibrio injensis]|uniref:lipopolysaccharide biosynthesis protein n=1 Tax=Vibrio injensis TaxID=1307414 RepID=UPI00278C57A1|nr:oligosaccharide flippase family protein [Vibrio injensis]
MINKYIKSKNIQNLVYLMMVNFGVLPISLITNIFLTKLLGVQDFGNFIYLTSLLGLFTTVFTFGFYQAGGRAILLSSSEKRKSGYYGAELVITLAIYFLLSISLICYLYFDVNFKSKNLDGYLFIFILSGWVLLLRRYYDVLFQADKKIPMLAFSKIIQPISFLSLIVFFYYVLNKNITLSIVLLLFPATHLITAFFVFLKIKPSFKFFRKRVEEIWLYNRKFGFQIYIGSIIPLSLVSFSGVFISYVSEDNSGVGFYGLALSLVSIISIVPNTIATVFYKDFSKMRKVPIKIIIYTIFPTLVSFLGMLILISPFIINIYSDNYAPVIDLVYIMGLGIVAHGMGDFYNRYLSANGFGASVKNAAILTGFFSFIINIIFIPIYKETGAAVSTALTGFFYFSLTFFYYIKVVRV